MNKQKSHVYFGITLPVPSRRDYIRNSVPTSGLEYNASRSSFPLSVLHIMKDFMYFLPLSQSFIWCLMIQKNFCIYLKTKAMILVTNAGLV